MFSVTVVVVWCKILILKRVLISVNLILVVTEHKNIKKCQQQFKFWD